jgi:hypothetical protein
MAPYPNAAVVAPVATMAPSTRTLATGATRGGSAAARAVVTKTIVVVLKQRCYFHPQCIYAILQKWRKLRYEFKDQEGTFPNYVDA